MPIRCRVNPIRLIQFWHTRHTVEQERNKYGVLRGSYLEEDRTKCRCVADTEVGGSLHPGQEHASFRVAGPGPTNDLRQVFAHRIRSLTSETIVRTEFDHEYVQAFSQNPVDAAQAPCARFSRNAGVHSPEGKAAIPPHDLESRDIAVLFALEPQPSSQTGPQEYDHGTVVGGNLCLGADHHGRIRSR